MLEGSPRKMAKRLQPGHQVVSRPLDGNSFQKDRKVTRRQSTAVLGRSTHHRANSYQALIQRPSTSMGNTQSQVTPNTQSTKSRSSYETVRATNQPPASLHPTRKPSYAHLQRSNLEARVRHGLQESVDMGPRLQRSTSGLAFDESSTEIHS